PGVQRRRVSRCARGAGRSPGRRSRPAGVGPGGGSGGGGSGGGGGVGRGAVRAPELEAAAWRAARRGARTTAAAAFERAADFVDDPVRRGALLLRAAKEAIELGRSQLVLRLLRDAESLPLGPLERAESMWLGDAFREGRAGDPARVHALVETAGRLASDGDSDLALNLVSTAAFRCFWGDLEHARQGVLEAADRIGVDPGNPRLL